MADFICFDIIIPEIKYLCNNDNLYIIKSEFSKFDILKVMELVLGMSIQIVYFIILLIK